MSNTEGAREGQGGGTHQDEWDGQWARIREMEPGTDDPLPAFQEIVNREMERLGNEVGRPLVMKVSVQVKDGTLNRPEDGEEDE